MNKKRLAAFGIVALGMMLTSSIVFTVAWYTGSSNLGVNDFEIRMSSKELTISVDNINFKESLTAEDFGLDRAFVYKPVSSAFSYDWISRKEIAPKFTDGYSDDSTAYNRTTLDSTRIANGGYFQREIYLKCSATTNVTFDNDSTFIKPNTAKNEEVATKLESKYPDLTHAEILENLNKVQKSMRFSLLTLNDTDKTEKDENYLADYDYNIIDPYKECTTKLGGLLDNDLDGYYDTANGYEVLYGEVNNASYENLVYVSNSSSNEPSHSHSCFDASHKSGTQVLDFAASSANGVEIVNEKSFSLNEMDKIRIPLRADVSKRIVISFYMEGWDLDNVAYTMYSRFFTQIGFTLIS